MVLSSFRNYLRVDPNCVHRASYKALWTGVFIATCGFTALILASVVFVNVAINPVEDEGLLAQYLGLQSISVLTSLLLIIPAAYLFKKASEYCSKNFSHLKAPSEIYFGAILVWAGIVHFALFVFGVNPETLLSEDSIFLIIVGSMTWAGMVVASTSLMVTGSIRILVGAKQLTTDSLYNKILDFVENVIKPVYSHYRLLYCLGYVENKTLFQSHVSLLKEGAAMAIDDALDNEDVN